MIDRRRVRQGVAVIVGERGVLVDHMSGDGGPNANRDRGAAFGFGVVGGDRVIESLVAGLSGCFRASDPIRATGPRPRNGR